MSPASTAEKVDTRYSDWLEEVRDHFAEREEFDLAEAIYPFAADFENGMTPAESFEQFDRWTSCDA